MMWFDFFLQALVGALAVLGLGAIDVLVLLPILMAVGGTIFGCIVAAVS